MNEAQGFNTYSLMQKDLPYKTFKKVIPARLFVWVINPFKDEIEELVVKGKPAKNEFDCYIPLWSEKEYLYFKRANKKHIDAGRLVESEYPKEEERPKSPNSFTDEEITALVTGPFMTLKRAVENITSEAAMARFVDIGEREDRPVKTMEFLRENLSLIQAGPEQESEE